MSTRITQTMMSRSMLSDLSDVSNRMSTTQRKMSSGKELTRPSDDPFATSRALDLRRGIEATEQFRRNVNEADSWSTVTDVALGGITDAVQRVRALTIQGANDSAGQAARNSIASEIDQLIETIKGAANSSYGGRFVFSGTSTDVKPYPAGSDTYAGDAATIAREIGPGVSVGVNVVGQNILGNGQGAADNLLLDTLRDIADHLRGGTPADANALRGTDLQRLDTNLDNILQVRAQVGATSNRLATAGDRLDELHEQTADLLSETEDADMAKTYVDFSMQQAVYQSALKAGANIVQASLLDFLR